MITNDCPECGRSFAPTRQAWVSDTDENLCGMSVARSLPLAQEGCMVATITRLKARVTELERMVAPRLRVWELSNGKEVWIVAETEEECWGYLEDQHGDTDEVAEHKENGVSWTRLPDDKKITLMVDEDGDVCELECGAPCSMPAWVWAVRHGAGFLGETE